MPLPKDTVGCLTNVNLGEVSHRRYHQTQLSPVADGPGGHDESRTASSPGDSRAASATPWRLFFACSLQARLGTRPRKAPSVARTVAGGYFRRGMAVPR